MLKIDGGHLQNRQSFENMLKRFKSIDFVQSQQDLYSKPHRVLSIFSIICT